MRFIKKIFLPVFLLALCLAAAGCGKSRAPTRSEKPLLLVSIAPYRFIVEQVAGSDFETRTIAPSNANPHAFEPTSTQVAEMAQGQIWFRIGEPFEEKLLSYLQPRMDVCDLRNGLPLLDEQGICCGDCGDKGDKNRFDRHIWLSPKLASLQAASVAQALAERFPEKGPLFQKNLAILQGHLAMLDIEIHSLLEPIKNRAILVSHPAFGYFCKEYGLEQISIEYEGKDPRPRHLEQILETAAARGADAALLLPQYNNKGTLLVAEQLSLPTHSIDPYSADYFLTLRKLAHLIAEPTRQQE